MISGVKALMNRKFHTPQISYFEELVPITHSTCKIGTKYVTYFIPISHFVNKNAAGKHHTPPSNIYMQRQCINTVSYTNIDVLLNLLNKFRKSDKMLGLPSILLLFRNEFKKFNKTVARMSDFNYHDIQITLKSRFWRVKK